MTDPSAACCKGKPVHMHGPESALKGEFQQFDGLKSCPSIPSPPPPFLTPSPLDVTGPSHAPSALLLIYDIFGLWTQTLHGADTLSLTKTSTSPTGLKTFVPDWFDGNEADIANWPADTDQKWAYIKGFFQQQADPEKTLKRMESVMEAIGKEYPEIENWGIGGYCWGGKVWLTEMVGGDSNVGFASRYAIQSRSANASVARGAGGCEVGDDSADCAS
ncbi:dienelactone hydrolase protein [Rutstroemia sp. NJR-2017a BBW]|nr:dienelactone hydrolase protein [Rutstroemia sp. NJR-2017a BBW]